MPDAPQVTITDPNDPREPGDLLVVGDDRPPFRLGGRGIAGLVVVALLAGGGVLYRQHRVTDRGLQRTAEAAFAEKDRYDLSTSNAGVFGEELGGGMVSAQVTAGTSDPALVMTGLFLTGTGVTRLAYASSTLLTTDSSLSVVAPVSCSASADGHYPRDWELELEVTPPSGRAHVVRLPLPPDQVRAAILTACDRPDPDVPPTPAL